MTTRTSCSLVTDPATLLLSYKEVKLGKETPKSLLIAFTLSVISYPLLLLGGLIISPFSTSLYISARKHQTRALKALSNPQYLQVFAAQKLARCEKSIVKTKTRAHAYLKELKLPENDEFLKKDFLQTVNVQETFAKAKESLQYLDRARRKIECRLLQKELLAGKDTQVETTLRIAELSFVKNVFERKAWKGLALASLTWMLPTGFFWSLMAQSKSGGTGLAYRGKKELLANVANFAPYTDAVDAHNQLVQKNNFLVPYHAK